MKVMSAANETGSRQIKKKKRKRKLNENEKRFAQPAIILSVPHVTRHERACRRESQADDQRDRKTPSNAPERQSKRW
jgi:hypothetical protein